MKSPIFKLKRFLPGTVFFLALLSGYFTVPPPSPDWITLESVAGQDEMTDWSDALEKAVKKAGSQYGNTIKLECGKTYEIRRPVKLEYTTSVKIEGCATDYEMQGRPATIQYTGGGESAFSFKSSYGLRIDGAKLQYVNPAFTGYLIDLSHTDRQTGGSGGDSAYITISNSTLTGTNEANNSEALIFTGGGIISRIETVHFFHARAGVKMMDGTTPALGNTYAYVWRIADCSFNLVDVGVLNPSSNTVIDHNTFEPNRFGKLVALDNDCGEKCTYASAVQFSNNYLGDGQAQTEPIVQIRRATAWNIFGNWLYSDTQVSRAAFTLDTTENINIFGNHAQPFETFVETTGGTTFGLSIQNNKVSANEWIRQTAACLSCNIIEPSRAGTSPGAMSKLNALLASDYASQSGGVFDIAFGNKATNQKFKSAGVYNVQDGAYGMQNGAVGIFSADNYDAPVFIASDNTVRVVVNGQGMKSGVPITVPDEKYNEGKWKTSHEVPTKKAVYQAFKNHLAEMKELIDQAVEARLAEEKAKEQPVRKQ
jgi:hypothetical protein